MTGALVIIGLSAAVGYAVLGWMYQRKKDEADLWRETAKRQVSELVTAAENNKALEAACHVLRAEKQAMDDYLQTVVEENPGLAGSYVRHQLHRAAAATGAQPAPARPAAGVPGGGGRGRAG